MAFRAKVAHLRTAAPLKLYHIGRAQPMSYPARVPFPHARTYRAMLPRSRLPGQNRARRAEGVIGLCALRFQTRRKSEDYAAMRHIDAFCHFFPPGLFAKMSATSGGTRDIGKRMQGVRTIHDLDARVKMMDEFDDYSEMLSLGLPPLDAIAGPD